MSRSTRATPQGDCFRFAAKFAADRPGSVVVHAEILHPFAAKYPGLVAERMYHGWVELNGMVYDWQTIEYLKEPPIPVAEFYEVADPVNVKRYPGERALGLMVRNGHWGPWE